MKKAYTVSKYHISTLVRVVLFFLLSTSCSEDKKLDPEIKSIDLDKMESMSDHIESISFVALESNDSAVIGGIADVKLYNDLLYVKNDRGEELFVFDKDGKYVYTFDHYGQGPEEYLSLCNYYVDEKGILVYDYVGKKLLQYDHGNNLIEKTDMGNGEQNFMKTKNQYILFEDMPYDGKISLNLYDSNKKQEKIIDLAYEKNEVYNHDYKPLSMINDVLYINMTLDNNLYYFDEKSEQIKVKYILDYGDKNLPKDFRTNNIDNIRIVAELFKMGMDKKMVFGIEGLFQLDSWIITSIDISNRCGFICYSSKEQKNYSLSDTEFIFECFDNNINVENGYIITTLQANYYNTFKGLQGKESSFMGKYAEQFLRLPQVDEEDNPIVCFIKLKE